MSQSSNKPQISHTTPNKVAMGILWLLIVLFLNGCDVVSLNENQTQVLAKVEGKYLFISDLNEIIPINLSHGDSIAWVNNFVNNWVKNRLMIVQAEKNLTQNQLDFSQQLESYRNSLVIYQYETLLIDQELDTTVSNQEISQYYHSHQGDFELKENIIRAYYVVVNSESAFLDTLSGIFQLSDTLALDSLSYFEKTPELLSLSTDTSIWMSFYQFQQVIPVETYNQELFLKNNRLIQLEENDLTYLVKVVDFKIKNDISPLEVEQQDIRNIIINQRKTKLIKRVREDIYNKALYNNEFEIY